MYPNQTVAGVAHSSAGDEPKEQPQTSNFLYQAATVLAILLFLISF
jgi:hypothetical protein